jgi:hypothetical protein
MPIQDVELVGEPVGRRHAARSDRGATTGVGAPQVDRERTRDPAGRSNLV